MERYGASKSTSGTGLYYPFVHPRNSSYLKASLLYWDRIRRIVPDGISKHDDGTLSNDYDEDVKETAKHGLLLATSPNQYQEAANRYFLDHIDPFIQDEDQLKQLSVAHLPGGETENRVCCQKMGQQVIEELQKRGIARRSGDWVALRSELGNYYMHCLACEMSRRLEAPLYTDTPDCVTWGQAMNFEPRPDIIDGALSTQLIKLNIKMPSPTAVGAVPLPQILKFHEQRKDERRQFRKNIEDLLDAASKIEDTYALNDYFADRRAEITEAVKNLRKTIDEIQTGMVNSVTKLTVPAAFTSATTAFALGHPEIAAILGALGISVGVVGLYAETRGKLRQANTSSPYYYLLSLEHEFGESALIDESV